jgi:hypothetical protein
MEPPLVLKLPKLPVPDALVYRYGRGRTFFPKPVAFSVPLLIATVANNDMRRFFGVLVDIAAPSIRDWVVYVPLQLNADLVPFKRTVYTMHQLEGMRNMWPDYGENAFLRRLVVFADNVYNWLPWRLCNPCNLLGFTVLGSTLTWPHKPSQGQPCLLLDSVLGSVSMYAVTTSTIKPAELDFMLMENWKPPTDVLDDADDARNSSQLLSGMSIHDESDAAAGVPTFIEQVPSDVEHVAITNLPTQVDAKYTLAYVRAEPTAINMAHFFCNFLTLHKGPFPVLESIRAIRQDFHAVLCKFKQFDVPVWTSQQHWNWLSDPTEPNHSVFLTYNRLLKRYEKSKSPVEEDMDHKAMQRRADETARKTKITERMAMQEARRIEIEEDLVKVLPINTSLHEFERSVSNRLLQERRRQRHHAEERVNDL